MKKTFKVTLIILIILGIFIVAYLYNTRPKLTGISDTRFNYIEINNNKIMIDIVAGYSIRRIINVGFQIDSDSLCVLVYQGSPKDSGIVEFETDMSKINKIVLKGAENETRQLAYRENGEFTVTERIVGFVTESVHLTDIKYEDKSIEITGFIENANCVIDEINCGYGENSMYLTVYAVRGRPSNYLLDGEPSHQIYLKVEPPINIDNVYLQYNSKQTLVWTRKDGFIQSEYK
jgi:hypothetical protein